MRTNVGLLLPVASLPGNHGIGDFGPEAYKWIDWLSKHHYRYWQVLPLNPLGFGNSPYMSTSSKAIDCRYISLDLLVEEGLLDEVPTYRKNSPYINYEKVNTFKMLYLRKAYKKYSETKMEGMKKFKTRYPWVMKYATYEVFKAHNNYAPWTYWSDYEIHYFDNHNNPPKRYLEEVDFIIFLQYVVLRQWKHLLAYAHEKNIQVICDMPFYVGSDSVECWTNKHLFTYDENNKLYEVGGVPPDAFSTTGQLWGFPIYKFDEMKKDNYALLVDRVNYLANICDYLRIDHFRAFDTYYVIPGDAETAINGEWKIGPRDEFFNALKAVNPNIKIIAEDLGDLVPSVIELRDRLGLPGMYVVEFKLFDPKPGSSEGMVVYSGTHDNETLYGWIKGLTAEEKLKLRERFHCRERDLYYRIIKYILSLPSFLTILPLQDILMLDNKARMNTPGTCGSPNFMWRMKDFSILRKNRVRIK